MFVKIHTRDQNGAWVACQYPFMRPEAAAEEAVKALMDGYWMECTTTTSKAGRVIVLADGVDLTSTRIVSIYLDHEEDPYVRRM